MEIKGGRVPRPDGCLPENVSSTNTERGPASSTLALATDGGALATTDKDRFTLCLRRIDERVRDLEFEIDQRRAELKDLDCALSVIERFFPDDHETGDIEAGTDDRNSEPLQETAAD